MLPQLVARCPTAELRAARARSRRSDAMYGSAHGEWESKGLLAVQPG